MQYKFTTKEIAALRILAALWTINAEATGARSMSLRKDSTQNHFVGMIGEYAFCKLKNLFFDFAPSMDRPSFGVDVMTNKNKAGDIKTTDKIGGNLILSTRQNKQIDFYVLAEYDAAAAVVRFIGHIKADEAYKFERRKISATKTAVFIPREQLTPF